MFTTSYRVRQIKAALKKSKASFGSKIKVESGKIMVYCQGQLTFRVTPKLFGQSVIDYPVDIGFAPLLSILSNVPFKWTPGVGFMPDGQGATVEGQAALDAFYSDLAAKYTVMFNLDKQHSTPN